MAGVISCGAGGVVSWPDGFLFASQSELHVDGECAGRAPRHPGVLYL